MRLEVVLHMTLERGRVWWGEINSGRIEQVLAGISQTPALPTAFWEAQEIQPIIPIVSGRENSAALLTLGGTHSKGDWAGGVGKQKRVKGTIRKKWTPLFSQQQTSGKKTKEETSSSLPGMIWVRKNPTSTAWGKIQKDKCNQTNCTRVVKPGEALSSKLHVCPRWAPPGGISCLHRNGGRGLLSGYIHHLWLTFFPNLAAICMRPLLYILSLKRAYVPPSSTHNFFVVIVAAVTDGAMLRIEPRAPWMRGKYPTLGYYYTPTPSVHFHTDILLKKIPAYLTYFASSRTFTNILDHIFPVRYHHSWGGENCFLSILRNPWYCNVLCPCNEPAYINKCTESVLWKFPG